MNRAFEEMMAAVRKIEKSGIGSREKAALEGYLRAIKSIIELEEETLRKLQRANRELENGGRVMYPLIEANNQCIRDKKKALESWAEFQGRVKRLMY